ASGWRMGADFKPGDVSTPPIGWLPLRQGKRLDPGGGANPLMLPQKSLRDLEDKTYRVARKQQQFPPIACNANRVPPGEKLPHYEGFVEYTMKLEFGKGEGLKLPGKIYICLPDEAQSVIAG